MIWRRGKSLHDLYVYYWMALSRGRHAGTKSLHCQSLSWECGTCVWSIHGGTCDEKYSARYTATEVVIITHRYWQSSGLCNGYKSHIHSENKAHRTKMALCAQTSRERSHYSKAKAGHNSADVFTKALEKKIMKRLLYVLGLGDADNRRENFKKGALECATNTWTTVIWEEKKRELRAAMWERSYKWESWMGKVWDR